LAPRAQPDGRSSVVNERYATGKLYCLNAYLSDGRSTAHMAGVKIHGLRVIEGVPQQANQGEGAEVQMPGGTSGEAMRLFPPHVGKRLLGEAPVETDGSFHIEVPADTPIQLQTLDADGMALRTCGWIWAKHREPRGCIGCHEDPELTPENRFVLALQRAETNLTLPAEDRRTVVFGRDVAPIIARRCMPCHDGCKSELDLNPAQAYASLIDGLNAQTTGGKPVVGKYVHPGQARTSPLIWRLLGRNTSRPWDASYAPTQVVPRCPPAHAVQLTGDEKRTLIEWIDLGANMDDVSAADSVTAGVRRDIHTEGSQ